MVAFTDFLEDELLDHVLRNLSYSPPATVYLALFTADPTDTGDQSNEVDAAMAGIGYARQAISGGSAFTAPSGGSTSNGGDLTFGPATANWGTVTHLGIMDAAGIGAGNMLFHGPLTSPRTVNNGDTLLWSTGTLTVTLS